LPLCCIGYGHSIWIKKRRTSTWWQTEFRITFGNQYLTAFFVT